ncbi:hypothetical protein CFOL_v3_19653 [Cephalotus follicularis]|uniref:Transposase MuDR plant domain-containing protein n=1 Tax=Cephalotus follicularis TaxID=3775 RepID=A0A1Q3C7X2_CEPFO|nr:hypothetical protein CFOL_v3_19653 [Cephalotus follicularis]
MVVKCSGDCPWKIYARVDGTTEALQIKSFNNEHTCHVIFKNDRVTTANLANIFKDNIKAIPKLKSKQLKDLARADLKVEVSIDMYKRAKKKVVEEIKENHKEDFGRLWSYAAKLRNTNPGSTIILDHTKRTNSFVVNMECRSSWSWFLQYLEDLGYEDDLGLTLMTYKHKV